MVFSFLVAADALSATPAHKAAMAAASNLRGALIGGGSGGGVDSGAG